MSRKKKIDTRWCEKLFPGVYAHLDTLTVGEVTVRPEAAAVVLAERNTKNRPIVAAQLRSLVAQMPLHLTGETIIFDWDSALINGQHRLQACVDTEESFRCVVVLGVDPAMFEYLDQHSRRGLSAILAINKEVHTSILAGSLAIVSNFFTYGRPVRTGGKETRTNHQLLELLEEHPGLRDCVNWIGSHRARPRTSLFGSTALVGALHYLFNCVDHDQSLEFWSALLLNEFDTKARWDAPRRLFNRMIDNQAAHAEKLTAAAISAYTVKTWNAFRSGLPLTRLICAERESFPKILDWVYDDELPVSAPYWRGNS